MTETTTPYQQIFACRSTSKNEDGDCTHGDLCDWTWECSACGRDVSAAPCPDHAPYEVPGLQLIECDKGHGRTWVLDDDNGYEMPCPWCLIAAGVKEHEGCEHSHHSRWRRWKATHRVLLRLYSLGVVSGYSSSYGHGCRGCAADISFGRSSYLLGWPRWKWQCLIAARHWPGEEVLNDICGKCNPCASCASQRFDHNDGCPLGTT